MKVSKTGYKKNSKHKNEPALVIPSNKITMKEDNGEPLKKGPILGTDNTGYSQMMYPGLDYSFPGSYVYELPMAKGGGHIVPGRYRNPEGNWLSKYQKGGFHQKIYIDPVEFAKANKLYNDSLDLYTKSLDFNKKNNPYDNYYSFSVPYDDVYWTADGPGGYFIDTPLGRRFLGTHAGGDTSYRIPGTEANKIFIESFANKIKPIGFNTTDFPAPVYKKPTEEPVYQERPKVEPIKSKDGKVERSELMPIRPTLMPPSNTMRVLRAIQEEDLRKQGAKNIPAPDFRHGGWLDEYQGDILSSEVRNNLIQSGKEHDYYNEALDWQNQWHNSPMYNQMVLNSFKGDQKKADYLTKLRKENLQNLPNLKINSESGDYAYGFNPAGTSNSDTGEVVVYPEGYDYGPSLYIHELSHSSDRPKGKYSFDYSGYKTNKPWKYFAENDPDKIINGDYRLDENKNVVLPPKWMFTKDSRFPGEVIYNDRVMPQSDTAYIHKNRGSNWKDNQWYIDNKHSFKPITDEEIALSLSGFNYPSDHPEYQRMAKELKDEWNTIIARDTMDAKERWKTYAHPYIAQPTEVRARLNQLRYDAQKQNLYDPFTEQITPEIFKKLNGHVLDNLKTDFTDEEILWMLQNISYNDKVNTDAIPAGKYGGSAKWLDKYQGDNKGTQVNNKLSKDAVNKGYTWSDEFGLMAPEVTVKPTISPEAIQSILNREAGMSIAPAPSSFDRRVSQAQYIMANPFDAFGNYVKQGYVPQGNLGNYGMREKSSPVGQLLMDFNPYNWANAGYRAAIRGGDPNTYTTLSGAGNMGTDLLEALPVASAFGPMYKSAQTATQVLGKGVKNLPKATKNELMARYLSRELDKGQLPSYVEKQVLAPRIDPIGRSSVNVKNDIVQQYGDSGYSQLIDDLYRQYRDAYDMPLIEFKSSRPNSFFSNVGSGQEAVEGTLFKEKFCLPGSECAKTSNAVTNKVFTEITGLPFAAQENAHNAWHLEDQMTRHGGKNVTEELAQGQLPKVGDRVLMGNDVNQSTFVPGYTADPEVRHAGFVAGYYPNSEGNLVPMIFESGKDSPLFLNPISNTFTGQNSVKQIIRPRQFLDNTFGKGLVDKNIRYAYRNKPSVAKYSSENETVQSLLSDAEQHRESIKRMHDLTNDEFDELLNSLIGIGAQETKLNAALPSGSLPAAKIKLQNTLADMGLTGPIKQTINLAKKTANTLTSKSSSLPKYPGTSFIEMESAKLADAQGIPFSEALKTIKSQYQPKPKFIPSTVEPSKGMFRQKFKTENARTSDFEHHITNDELGHGLSQMAENFSKIKKLYPEATPRQLIDLTTLMWNSPGKAQNKQLVDFYLLGKGNPNPAKFKFDYLNKVNKYKDQLINIHPQSTDSYREIFRAGYPEIQYKKGGSTKWLDKYQGKTRGSQTVLMLSNATPPANLPWINQQGQFTQVPPVQPKSFERKVDEMLGSPQKKAWEKAKDIDNERHGLASLYTQQKLQEYLDPVSAAAAANILGVAHEIANLPERIKNSKSASGVYHNLRETGEDIINNAIGAGIGMIPFVPLEAKESFLMYLSDNNMMPDGVSMAKGDMYWKKKKGGEPYPSLGYYEYIGGYSGIFAKGGVSSKKSSWLNKYK